MQNDAESVAANSHRLALKGKKIILGVTGSVAAYKAAYIASGLVKRGADVHVVLTEHASKLVAPATFWSITSNKVLTDLFEPPESYEITHVALPESADLMLIAPATANIIGKLANGIADDMLSTMALVVRCPFAIAPAMNANMFGNPIVVFNIERLRQYERIIIEPDEGRLACGDDGVGRLADPDRIINTVQHILVGRERDLIGVKVLVSAGPTQEAIDPVRFITNRSSGKMGYAIAARAAARGAEVTLVSGPTELAPPAEVEVVQVTTVKEMLDAVTVNVQEADIFISAAAPADFVPIEPRKSKIKKSEHLTLDLAKSEDILASVGKNKGSTVLVGFAAETDNLLEYAKAKLADKNLDLVVANDVSNGSVFGSDSNEVVLLSRTGDVIYWPRMSKGEIANGILDYVMNKLMEDHK